MNHIFRSIWSTQRGTFIAVSENTSAGGQRASAGGSGAAAACVFSLKTLAASLMLAFGAVAAAAPVNGVVVAGNATISQGAGTTTIVQGSQNAILNWQGFNIGAGESVTFVQPNSAAIALNRVLGADPSSILGTLSANGKVFLINPNGILFGRGASVNVAGLVASTLDVGNDDFMAGRYKFSGLSEAAVRNDGRIVADGGFVALLGARVSNQGVIQARMGSVALAAGKAVTLDLAGDAILNVSVDQGALQALAENGGLIQADGGQVLMTAQAAGSLLHTAVNNSGIVQAQTLEQRDGSIRLLGDMQSGTVNAGGTLDASAPQGGRGGLIETSAAHVAIADDLRVTSAAAHGATGNWLIDPVDFTIAAGSGALTGSGIGATTLQTSLTSSNVSIATGSTTAGNGDIFVNSPLTWAANKLTLSAHRDININASLNASATASLALEYGLSSAAAGNSGAINVRSPINLPAGNSVFTTRQGSDGIVKNFTVITALGAAGSTSGSDLQGMGGNLAIHYALGSDIDASATSLWNAGSGFMPVGDRTTPFTGSLAGLGHVVSGLTINRPAAGLLPLGLFGQIGAAGTVSDLGLAGGSVGGVGSNTVGALAGFNEGKIVNSDASITVLGQSTVGGLVGENKAGGIISGSYSSGAVSASGQNVGGLVGNNFGSISNAYATGTVTSSGSYVGGLVGRSQSSISNSYATGAVSGNAQVGGLIGLNGGTLATSYASGAASGNSAVAGLAGASYGTISNSYWNASANGSGVGVDDGASSGVAGLSTVQMQTAANFAGFTFTATRGATGNNWVMLDIDGTLNNAGAAVGATRPMLATEYTQTVNNTHQLQLMAMGLGATYVVGRNIDAAATAGTSDVWSGSFIPVGYSAGRFTGTFDGQRHTISGLTVNLPGRDQLGLFGATLSSTINNIGLLGGSVSGRNIGGGIAGYHNGTINNSYNTGSVTMSGNGGGGLVGTNGDDITSTINTSYATGTITGTGTGVYYGGLAGVQRFGSINNSYATGDVTNTLGNTNGGLVGFEVSGTIRTSYATGKVSGASSLGGLVGIAFGQTISSYWNKSANPTLLSTGSGSRVGATGLTTTQMKTASSFASFDTGATWMLYEQNTLPLLRTFLTPLTVTPNSVKTYDGAAFTGGALGYSTAPNLAKLLGTASFGGTAQGAIDAGNYTLTTSGLYSNQQGYLISYATGALTVNKATLALSGSRGYDGSSAVGGSVLTATGVAGQTFAVSGAGDSSNLASRNVQNNSALATVTGLTLAASSNGGQASNYQDLTTTGSAVSVTRADLTIAPSTVSKAYDGQLTAAATALVDSGQLFAGDTISGGSFAFTDKNAGSGKTVLATGVTVNDGNGGNNYRVSYAANANSTISQAILTASASAVNKTYDGDAIAAAVLTITDGLAGAETVTVNTAATFNSKDVATASLVTVNTVTLADGGNGGLASNYRLASGQTVAATIAAKELTAAASAASKTYDGNTRAAAQLNVTGGLVGSETVVATGAAAFNSKDVATANLVTVNSVTLADGANGGLASNYRLASGQTAAASIAAKELTAAVSAAPKTYDGTTSAAVALNVTGGLVGSEMVVATGTATFNSKDVSTANLVTVNRTLLADGSNGGLASNYRLGSGQTAAASITAKALSASASAVGKTYDGTTSAMAQLRVTGGLIGSETVAATADASFNSKDVATATLVTVNGTRLADGANGGLASNYQLASGQTAVAAIAPRALTIGGLTAASKTYDGNASAALRGGALEGLVAGETLAFATQGARFDDQHAGAGKAVTVSGTRLIDGTGLASNYSVANPAALVADIARLAAVTWVGGASGNWFDAANWAGGAVPQLADVANVIIPAGVTVTLNNGKVSLDSLDGGGSLRVLDGTLTAAAAIALAGLEQSGGAISGADIKLGSLDQRAGTLASEGNIAVRLAYRQSERSASVLAAGTLAVVQASGSALLGNISTAGTVDVTAVDGNIVQLAGTRLASAGASLSAPNGVVTLAADGSTAGAVTIRVKPADAVIGAGDAIAPAAGARPASEQRRQDAIASALAPVQMAAVPTVRASAGAPAGGLAGGPAGGPAGVAVSASNAARVQLEGLNVTLVAEGVRLPAGLQVAGGAEEDKLK